MTDPRPRSYAQAGVGLARATRFLEAIKPLVRLTRRPGSLGSIGGFGGLFDLRRATGRDLLLVSSADGVGTKLALARRVGRYEGLGVDLVAMNVNDVLCTGAEPWFFLDYLATGRIDPEVLVEILRGVVRGCCEAHCALVGGETAEMPLVYRDGGFDLAGFCVGAVPRDRLITGTAIRPGDRVLGLASNGLHANGFTLVQRVLSWTQQRRWASELLKPTRIYVTPVLALLKQVRVHGLAHITGGAFREKLGRILPAGTAARLARRAWPVPKVFWQIQGAGGIVDAEMYRTFNMGIGMVVVVRPADVGGAQRILQRAGVANWVIGDIVRGHREVTFV